MSEVSERLARVIENDYNGEIKRTMRVAQSDVMGLLSQYMDVQKLDMVVDKTSGGYTLTITVVAPRIYNIGNTSDE